MASRVARLIGGGVLCLALVLALSPRLSAGQSVDALAAGLLDKNSKYEAFSALARLVPQDERALNALVWALREHRDWIHRSWVAQLLGPTRDDRAVEPIGAAAREDKNDDVRASAIRALGEINSPHAAEALSRVVREQKAATQRTAAETLGMMGTEAALGALDSALADPVTKAVAAAALAQYDIRNKPHQTIAGTDVTFIGLQRTNTWEMYPGQVTARKGADLAIVFFRLAAAQPTKDAPILISMQDADGKPISRADGFTINFFAMKADGRGSYYDIPFAVEAGRRPTTVQIQGANFSVESLWRVP